MMIPAASMQVPALTIFESSFRRGKFDKSRQLSNGSLLEFTHIFPMDAVYDTPEEVPEDVRSKSGLLADPLNCYQSCIH